MNSQRTFRTIPLSQRARGPAQTLADAVKLCDPATPLDPVEDTALRQDLTNVRGGDRLRRIVRNIRRSGGIATLHFLTGHIGSGKTTELLRMREVLARPEGDAPAQTVLYLDADSMLDRYDVDLEDILVGLWMVIVRERPAAVRALTPIWKERLSTGLVQLALDLPKSLPDAIEKLVALLRLPGLDQRQKLRSTLSTLLSPLIEGVNRALAAIREDAAGEVIILIDNLEKLSEGQQEAVKRLYVERMGALKELDAHLVITVPLSLVYAAEGASLTGLYGGEVVMLPMIKTRERAEAGGGDHEPGLAAMADLLSRRVDFERLFADGRSAALQVARLSGGCIRHALRMVLIAVNEHDEPPVSGESVETAAVSLQAEFDRALPEAWISALHAVARTNQFPDDCDGQVKRGLLRNLFVLEYQNGGPDVWHAVHPLVERCRKYREHAAG